MSASKRVVAVVLTTFIAMGMSAFYAPVALAQTACAKSPETKSELVPMSDEEKTQLSVNYWLPSTEEHKWPTILHMTPYGKADEPPDDEYSPNTADCYARVSVDIRGTGASEGVFCVFCPREQKDGREVVEWIARQSWSDGKVGMIGSSYAGITALFTAAQFGDERTSPLKAIAPQHVLSDTYRDAAWHNGLFSSLFVSQWGAYQAEESTRKGDPHRLSERVGSTQPLEARLDEWDGPFYRERALYEVDHRITVPTFLWGGWFDGFSRGTIRTFQGISSANKMLVMDPFGHHYGGPGGTPFQWFSVHPDKYDPPDPRSAISNKGSEPLSPYLDAYGAGDNLNKALVNQWFDHFLEPEATDEYVPQDETKPRGGAAIDACPPGSMILAGSAVCYYDLGTKQWSRTETWPPANVGTADLFLGGSDAAVTSGTLSFEPSAGTTQRAFAYEPTTGVSETFSKYGEVAATPQIPVDQKHEHAKSVVYATEALQEPLELAGPMELRFWGKTTAPDVAWIVKVSHIHADGQAQLITSGYMRASHRAWDEELSEPAEPWIINERPGPGLLGQDAPYIPAEDLSKPTEYRIDIWPTAMTIPKGNRLAISITSADVPTHEPLPFPAVNTILHDAAHPSRLIVTVVQPPVEPSAPQVGLAVTPEEVSGKATVDISGTVQDVDGIEDVAAASVDVVDGDGAVVGSWDLSAFTREGEVLVFSADDFHLTGPSPWRVVVGATDTHGLSASTEATVTRSHGRPESGGSRVPE